MKKLYIKLHNINKKLARILHSLTKRLFAKTHLFGNLLESSVGSGGGCCRRGCGGHHSLYGLTSAGTDPPEIVVVRLFHTPHTTTAAATSLTRSTRYELLIARVARTRVVRRSHAPIVAAATIRPLINRGRVLDRRVVHGRGHGCVELRLR